VTMHGRAACRSSQRGRVGPRCNDKFSRAQEQIRTSRAKKQQKSPVHFCSDAPGTTTNSVCHASRSTPPIQGPQRKLPPHPAHSSSALPCSPHTVRAHAAGQRERASGGTTHHLSKIEHTSTSGATSSSCGRLLLALSPSLPPPHLNRIAFAEENPPLLRRAAPSITPSDPPQPPAPVPDEVPVFPSLSLLSLSLSR
jgi:hypothetical protein